MHVAYKLIRHCFGFFASNLVRWKQRLYQPLTWAGSWLSSVSNALSFDVLVVKNREYVKQQLPVITGFIHSVWMRREVVMSLYTLGFRGLHICSSLSIVQVLRLNFEIAREVNYLIWNLQVEEGNSGNRHEVQSPQLKCSRTKSYKSKTDV